MMAADVEMNEEIEPGIQDGNCVEQSLLDVNTSHVKDKVTFTKL
jgi:hypothetical protein